MYFLTFPKMYYDIEGDGTYKLTTNILKRVAIRDAIKNNVMFWDEYDVVEGDTPENLAHKFYGSSDLHWIILLANDIIDPFYDWPLGYFEFEEYLTKKYGSVQQINAVHHYETKDAVDGLPDGLIVSSEYPNKVAVTNREYEEDLNEDKRRIKIIRTNYVGQIVNEFERLMEQ